MCLDGKIALVTGAGGGIGSQIALDLADNKINVVLFGGNNLEKLEKTRKLVTAKGVKAWVFPCDLTDSVALEKAFNDFLSLGVGLDILINNAGLAVNCSIEDTDIELFDRVMALNVRAPFILTKLCLPLLKKSKRASIINIASVTAHAGYPLQSAYVASKHALLGFTKSLATEVYKDGIRVHAVSPGGVFTDMIKVSRPDLTGTDMIMPKDISDIVMFFLKNRTNAVIDEIMVHRANKEPFLT